MKTTDKPIVIDIICNCTLENAWKAITELDQMKLWFFENIPSFNPETGFSTSFEVKNENRVFTHLWTITEVIPNQKISYNWKYRTRN